MTLLRYDWKNKEGQKVSVAVVHAEPLWASPILYASNRVVQADSYTSTTIAL